MDYLCEINFARGEPAEPCAHGISTFVSREGWLLKGLFGVLRLKHEIENVRFSRRWAATLVRRDGARGKMGRDPRGEGGGGERATCKRTTKPIPHPNSASVTVSNPISDMVIREWARKCEAFNQRDSLSSSVPRFSPRRPCTS